MTESQPGGEFRKSRAATTSKPVDVKVETERQRHAHLQKRRELHFAEILLPSYGLSHECVQDADGERIEISQWWACTRCVARIVYHRWFERVFGFLIVANAVLMGLEADDVISDDLARQIELGFTIAFLIEITLRFIARHKPVLKDHVFMLDSLIVAFASIDNFLIVHIDGVDLSMLTVLRLFRILRFARFFRTVAWVRPLRLIMESIKVIVLTFLWVLILLVLFIVTFSYFLRILLANVQEGDPQYKCVHEYFFSTRRTMATIMETMCRGFPWTLEITYPLLNKGTELAATIWIICVMMQAVMIGMIIPGMFIEELMTCAAETDKETQKERCVKHRLNLPDMAAVFRMIDVDGDHHVSKEEFCKGIRDHEDVQALFSVDEEDAEELFFALDEHGTGELWIDDFILGAIRTRCGSHTIANMSFDWSSRRATRVLEMCHPILQDHEHTIENLASTWDLLMSKLKETDFGKYMPEAIESADVETRDDWKLKHCMLDHHGALSGADIEQLDRLETKIKLLLDYLPTQAELHANENSGISSGNFDDAQGLLNDVFNLHYALEKAAEADATYASVLEAARAKIAGR